MLPLLRALPLPIRTGLPALALAALLALAACGDGSPAPTPSPTPSPSPSAAPSPTPSPTPTPSPPPSETTYRFIYREFGQTEDIIWRVNPTDVESKEQLAVIPHREGWGVKPSLSPDGELLAYVAMSAQGWDPAYQSDLYILDLVTKETAFVSGQVDLTFQPLWSPDSKLIYARRNVGQEVAVLQVKVARKPRPGEPTPTPTPVPSPDQTPTPPEDPVQEVMRENMGRVLTFVPVGFAEDGRSMFFVQIQGGTGGVSLLALFAPATWEAVQQDEAEAKARQQAFDEAVRAALETEQPTPTPSPTPTPRAKFVAELTDQIARDYDLSPDRRKFAFVAPQLVGGEIISRAMSTDIITTVTSAIPAEGLPGGDQLRPSWHPDSTRLAVGLLPGDGRKGGVALVNTAGGPPEFLPPPESGFDVPRGWSPDGNYLAVINFSGRSPANPGRARLELLSPAGHRISVADGVDVEVLGWFPAP